MKEKRKIETKRGRGNKREKKEWKIKCYEISKQTENKKLEKGNKDKESERKRMQWKKLKIKNFKALT